MKAYYVHWAYPETSDSYLYYSGKDDDKLFHHRENAVEYAEDKLEEYKNIEYKVSELQLKSVCEDLTDEESDFYTDNMFRDFPYTYSIRERNITFEDEL